MGDGMVDRENIINGLQESAAYFRSSFDAMYGTYACEKFRSWTDAIEQAIALLKAQEALPAVDAVPVAQGEWVEEPDRVNHYHCSNCGVVWGVMSKAMKYCPNCAAKMTNSPMWNVEGERRDGDT